MDETIAIGSKVGAEANPSNFARFYPSNWCAKAVYFDKSEPDPWETNTWHRHRFRCGVAFWDASTDVRAMDVDPRRDRPDF